ncbi:MAG TPA: SWIM zinc finger family protein [Stellaceae bacterium]|nr:SWIM zinc finger family protein [Stellaceae bacterium]
MPLRLDMWDDATLEAATSRGMVRRARRDLETGTAQVSRHDHREAIVEMADAVVTVRHGGLDETTCTCPSSEVCRHVIGALLLLRDRPSSKEARASTPSSDNVERFADTPSPAPDPVAEILAFSEKELIGAFGRALLSRAGESAERLGEPRITVSGSSCIVEFEGHPEVRYLAGLGIAGMICKASAAEARILRAQTLLAIRGAHGLDHPRGEASRDVADHDKADTPSALLDIAHDLLIEWARLGLAAAPEALEDRLFDAAVATRAGGLFRLSAALRRLSEDVRRRRERDVEFEALVSLRAASRCFALIEALRRSPSDTALRGYARETFEPIGDITLVGCGVEVWKTPSGARGATAHFYAPEQRRWFTASLARANGQDPSFVPELAIEQEPVWGSILAKLARSEIRLRGAAASPSGRLSLSRDTEARLVPARYQRETEARWENSFSDWAELDAFVRQVFAPSLRGGRRNAEIVILAPARIGHPTFDEIAQELIVPVFDRRGKRIDLVVENVSHRQNRIRAMEASLRGKLPEAIFTTLAIRGETVGLFPYAFVGHGTSTLFSLDRRHEFVEEKKHSSLKDRILGRSLVGTRIARPPPTASVRASTERILHIALDQVLGLCELGGRMHDPGSTAKIAALGDRMDGIGLHPVASLLTQITITEGRRRAEAILIAVHALDTICQFSRKPLC